MRLFLIMLSLALFTNCAGEAKTLSKEAYRDLAIAAIERAHPDLKAEAQGDLTLAEQGDAKPSRVFLDTGYAEYLAAPEQLDSIIAKWVAAAAMLSIDAKPESGIRGQIVSLIRSRDYLETYKQLGDGNSTPPDVLWRPFGGDLIVMLMVNSPTTLRSLQMTEVVELGMTLDEAWAVSFENLKAEMGPLNLGDLNGDGPFSYGPKVAWQPDCSPCRMPAPATEDRSQMVASYSCSTEISSYRHCPMTRCRSNASGLSQSHSLENGSWRLIRR